MRKAEQEALDEIYYYMQSRVKELTTKPGWMITVVVALGMLRDGRPGDAKRHIEFMKEHLDPWADSMEAKRE